MNEYRPLTNDEISLILPALVKCGIQNNSNVFRFIDTKLDKLYDVYLLDQGSKTILKKTTPAEYDMAIYTRYFAGHHFAVPKILNAITVGEDHFVRMEFAEGSDARGCTEADAKSVGKALAHIQSYYLTTGGRTENAKSYYKRQIGKHIEAIKPFYSEYAAVFDFVEQRFFEAPQTLIHDDLLPINVFLNDGSVQIIDWEYADILPYFLDLGRFAFVYDMDNRFFISEEAAESFLKQYYQQMKKNPEFRISEKAFRVDVAVSAFCQYVLFVAYSLNKTDAKSSVELCDSRDNLYLKKIILHLQAECCSW